MVRGSCWPQDISKAARPPDVLWPLFGREKMLSNFLGLSPTPMPSFSSKPQSTTKRIAVHTYILTYEHFYSLGYFSSIDISTWFWRMQPGYFVISRYLSPAESKAEWCKCVCVERSEIWVKKRIFGKKKSKNKQTNKQTNKQKQTSKQNKTKQKNVFGMFWSVYTFFFSIRIDNNFPT